MPSPDRPDPAVLDFLRTLVVFNGYRDCKLLPVGRYACIRPKAFTHAIIVGRIGDYYGIDDTWCYQDLGAALAALAAWNGRGEPVGWHRHPASGRRVSQSPDEIDDDGNEVGAVGVRYRRR